MTAGKPAAVQQKMMTASALPLPPPLPRSGAWRVLRTLGGFPARAHFLGFGEQRRKLVE